MEINLGLSSGDLFLQLSTKSSISTTFVKGQSNSVSPQSDSCCVHPISELWVYHVSKSGSTSIQLRRPYYPWSSFCLSPSWAIPATTPCLVYLLNSNQIKYLLITVPTLFLVPAVTSSPLICCYNAFIDICSIIPRTYSLYCRQTDLLYLKIWSHYLLTQLYTEFFIFPSKHVSQFQFLLYAYLITLFVPQATLNSIRHLLSIVSPQASTMPGTEPVITIYSIIK